ncbi:deoxyribonuclease V [Calditrichota bacterium]
MNLAKARELQIRLSEQVVSSGDPNPEEIGYVAGVDSSISRDKKNMIGSVALFAMPNIELICTKNCITPVVFPYIPGYLSFRELPVMLEVMELLPYKPDLIIVDGHGTAHPRRFGIASHLGVVTGYTTIGCAKKKLTGTCDPPGREKGSTAECLDDGDRIGTVVRTRENVSPVWVSTGHRISQSASVKWILRTTTKYRLPEPIRAAHQAATMYRKQV